MKKNKTFSILDYFSAFRIFAAIIISLLFIFIIIFFVSDQPIEAISKMMVGPAYIYRSGC